MNYIKNFLPPFLFFLLIILIWEILVLAFHTPNYLLPAPHEILSEIAESKYILLKDMTVTMTEAILGFLLGSTIGILIAIGFAHSKTMELSVYPFAIAVKTIPVVAIAPLVVMWFGNGILSKVVISALISFFPAIVNTVRGLKSISTETLDLMNSLSATKWQIFTKVRFPTSLPYIFSALKIASTLSVVGAIVGELVGANQGLGYVILVASWRLETNMLFAALIASSVGAIAFFLIISLLEKYFLSWHVSAIEE